MDYNDYVSQNKSDKLHFWYKARLVLIDNLLKKISDADDNLILDVGCGTGTELDILKKYGKVIALDVNENSLKLAKNNNCQTICMDIENHSLKSDTYDIVCCFDVLEHLKKDEQVLKNISNSLKNGGHFIFTVPAYQLIFGPHDKALGHFRRYNKSEIREKLRKANFKIICLGYWNFIFLPLLAILRILKRVVSNFSRNASFKTELKNNNYLVNKIMFSVLKFEANLANKVNVPFGLSIFGIVKK